MSSLYGFVNNYDDCDPISLDDIADLPVEQAFIIKVGKEHVHAYDACAWLPHFAFNRPCEHPVTRQRVNEEDIWECYTIARRRWPNSADLATTTHNVELSRALQLCESTNLEVLVKERADENGHFLPPHIRVVPKSPLFHLRMLQLKSVTACAEQDNNKEVRTIEYELVDSRNHQRVCGHRRTAKITYPKHAMICVSV
jgi:hypothetical protein